MPKDQVSQDACSMDNLIDYPCEFPIKIMGVARDDFASTMVDIIVTLDPEFHIGKISVRASAQGNYLGLTATVHATSREQLDDIYRSLSSHPMVKVVL